MELELVNKNNNPTIKNKIHPNINDFCIKVKNAIT